MAPSRFAYIVDGRVHFKKNRKLLLLTRMQLTFGSPGTDLS